MRRRERKETMKKTMAIVMLAVLLLGLLAACGGKDGGSSAGDPLLGTYKFSKMEDMTVQELADLLYDGDVEKAQSFMVLELKSGGKGVFSSDDDSDELSWKVEGEKLILSAKDENGEEQILEGTIKDGVVTLDLDGEFVELAK